MTVSFFVTLRDSKKHPESVIKFGSYDKDGLAPGAELQILRTVSKETWDIAAS